MSLSEPGMRMQRRAVQDCRLGCGSTDPCCSFRMFFGGKRGRGCRRAAVGGGESLCTPVLLQREDAHGD